jgi:hypothetical protein
MDVNKIHGYGSVTLAVVSSATVVTILLENGAAGYAKSNIFFWPVIAVQKGFMAL